MIKIFENIDKLWNENKKESLSFIIINQANNPTIALKFKRTPYFNKA